MIFTGKDLKQIQSKGINLKVIEQQIENFKTGFPFRKIFGLIPRILYSLIIAIGLATLAEISLQAKAISDANMTIASASEQQSQVTEEIARRLNEVQDTSRKSQQQTQSISDSSSKLANLANNLNGQINRFKLS